MAFVAPFIPYLLTGASAVAGVMAAQKQAEVGKQNAEAAKKAAMFNAGVDQRNASVALDQATQDADMQQREARRRIGAARAAYGAAGVTDAGSPLDVLEESAANAERDKQTILAKGRLRATGYADAATLDTMRADSADIAGRSASQIGNYGEASAILTGATRAYSYKGRGAQSGYKVGDYSNYGTSGISLVED